MLYALQVFSNILYLLVGAFYVVGIFAGKNETTYSDGFHFPIAIFLFTVFCFVSTLAKISTRNQLQEVLTELKAVRAVQPDDATDRATPDR